MTIHLPVSRVVKLLESSGFRSLSQPALVGGIPFEFAAMLTGITSLDLVAVIDTLGPADESRMRAEVEGLSRALDLAKSRRPLTIVLVGPPPRVTLTHALSKVCRVLVVGSPTGDHAGAALLDGLSVLLPLHVEADTEAPPESWLALRESLLGADPTAEMLGVIEASESGPEAVTEALREMLTLPFAEDQPA
jgi:hypothetical protein